MTDEDSFTGRVRRYARVGSAMAGLGARLGAERYLGVPIDRERHAAEFDECLAHDFGQRLQRTLLSATYECCVGDLRRSATRSRIRTICAGRL